MKELAFACLHTGLAKDITDFNFKRHGDNLRKPYIRHVNLRKSIEEMYTADESIIEDAMERCVSELRHSCLIVAYDRSSDSMNFIGLEMDGRDYGLLFTDMDEFRKVFSDDDCQSHAFDFEIYCRVVEREIVDGFILNIESESFMLKRQLFLEMEDLPQDEFDITESFTTQELCQLKEGIDNFELEEFIGNPRNIENYEGLFEKISNSTLLTLMLSKDDLTEYADGGIISMKKTGPLGFLYIDEIGGEYATVYTSESRISNVETSLNKFSQIVNFSQMANFILNDDMDGIIINPNTDNVLLTRDVLLKYYSLLEKTCNDSRLNSAIFHMFLIDEV